MSEDVRITSYKKWWILLSPIFVVLVLLVISYNTGYDAGKKDNYDLAYLDGFNNALDERVNATDPNPAVSDEIEKPEPESTTPKQWVEVKTFTGTGYLTTENFTISSNNWRMTASGTGDPNSASFTTYVYSDGKNPETSGSDSQLGIDGLGPETSYPKLGKGTYFLSIISANANWTVKIEEEH